MKEVVSSLLGTSLYAAALTLAILSFRRAFKKHISARFQYLCWALLLLRLLLPVTLESGLHADALFPAAPASAPTVSKAQGGVLAAPDSGALPSMLASERKAGIQVQAAEGASAPVAPDPVKKNVDPYAAALSAWLAGAGLTFAWLLAVRLRFSRRVRRALLVVDENTAFLYGACARRVGVEKAPCLMITTGEKFSPSLAMLGGKPAILLPEALLPNADALRYAMLHELTHYRRGDHLTMLLCAFLRCAHWFNPFVWLAFSKMQSDMESACDARVLTLIAPEEKRDYLLALLSLFTCGRQPALHMARFRTKRLAEKRMSDAFMQKRTGKLTRLFAAVLCAALLLGCFTTACQPTPEQDIVINKNEGVLEDAIAATPAPTGTLAPTETTPEPVMWMGTAENATGKLKVIAEAQVIVPNVPAFPIYRVDPCADFTQEFVTAVHEQLLDGCPLINQQKEMTRAEAEALYLEACRRLAEFEKKGIDALSVIAEGNTPEEQVEDEIKYAKEDIERYGALMKTAPETVPDAYIEPDAFRAYGYGLCGFSAIPEYGDYQNRGFFVMNGSDGSSGRDYASYMGLMLGAQYVFSAAYDATREQLNEWMRAGRDENMFPALPQKLAMTPQEAEVRALSTLERLNYPHALRVVSNAVRGIYGKDGSDGRAENNYAYLLSLEPIIGGIPVFSQVSRRETDTYDTGYFYDDEEITIALNDTGLHELSIEGLFSVGEQLNANVALMDIEEIKERIVQQLLLESSYSEEDEEREGNREIRITRIELGYGRTVTKGDPAGQTLIPMWNVYCSYIYPGQEEYAMPFPAVTLNAIDGSRM